jgi:ferredoxin
MKNIRPLDKSSSPYYVDNRFCTGHKCVYKGILIVDASGLSAGTWSIKITDRYGDDADIALSDITIGAEPTNDEAATAIYDAILAKIADKTISARIPVDVVGVAGPYGTGHIEEEMGRGAIYVYGDMGISFSGEGIFTYINDGDEAANFYHLCRNISLIFGSCREDKSQLKENANSNITSANLYVPEAGAPPARWEAGTKPIILNNCMMCDYCITYCPRKAIHNRIDGTSKAVVDIPYGEEEGAGKKTLKEQLYRNDKAMSGEDAYSGVYSSGDTDGGEW